jgi:hypothetical protein
MDRSKPIQSNSYPRRITDYRNIIYKEKICSAQSLNHLQHHRSADAQKAARFMLGSTLPRPHRLGASSSFPMPRADQPIGTPSGPALHRGLLRLTANALPSSSPRTNVRLTGFDDLHPLLFPRLLCLVAVTIVIRSSSSSVERWRGGDGCGVVGEMGAAAWGRWLRWHGGDGDHGSSPSVLLSLANGALVFVPEAVFVDVDSTPVQVYLCTSYPSPGG